MSIEPVALSSRTVLRLAVTAQSNESDRGAARHLADAPGYFVAVRSRQSDVEKNGIGAKRIRLCQCIRRGIGRCGLVPIEIEHHAERISRVSIVIDNQNASRFDTDGFGVVTPGYRRRRKRQADREGCSSPCACALGAYRTS